MHRLVKQTLAAGVVLAALTACGTETRDHAAPDHTATRAAVPAPPKKKPVHGLPGMPPVLDPQDVYAADRPDKLSPVVKDFPSRVYVPNTESDTVSVIDPKTYRIIETIHVAASPNTSSPPGT